MASYSLEIISPEQSVYSAEVTSIIVPGLEGYFGVQAGHIPMIVALGVGELTIREAGGRDLHMALRGGFFEVAGNRAVILADQCEPPGAIDPEAARKRLESARRLLDDLETSGKDRQAVRQQMDWASLELKVLEDEGMGS